MKLRANNSDYVTYDPEFIFKTNKYLLELYWESGFLQEEAVILTRVFPFRHYHTIKIINRKTKREHKVPAKLFFSILPDLNDMYKYYHYLSDNKVNEKVERVLKLLIFS
jgi:hypothetical protein